MDENSSAVHGNPQELLYAFREHYNRYIGAVTDVLTHPSDEVVLGRLEDDLREYSSLVEESHHGRPTVIRLAHTGRRGRPRIEIDPRFLEWAYRHRTTSGISTFLHVGRTTVRNALLEYGIRETGRDPFAAPHQPEPPTTSSDNSTDEILDPLLPPPAHLPPDVRCGSRGQRLTEPELDSVLLRLRTHFRRTGIRYFQGILTRLGYHVTMEEVRQSLIRIDPVHRVFHRILIRRRRYSVAGPMALWHHDGQHGISVHNVRIERLWVDVTVQVGAAWADRFTMLEISHGLDINNVHHIWLIHFLFLPIINSELAVFAEGHNNHPIQVRDGPDRTPIDLYGFDSLALGVRGDEVSYDNSLSADELEVYGVDWEALRDEHVMESRRANNHDEEGTSSWTRSGPPSRLNEVFLAPPENSLPPGEVAELDAILAPLSTGVSDEEIAIMWNHAVANARLMWPDYF
ncbi:hypothetical protein BD626DRAFT_404602 [Schizophyllum amplum]|uniref:Integrase core domain-containing protein n=1 Tax=Schizophyllum amplum TaxID=97359 RepID=A0A550CB52_9AGAR|nr:hypothetical protein BD626DRAFT_404602 [Auriculariopsis ampla]